MNASTELRLANKVIVSSEILSRGRAADSGDCLILLVEVGMVTDRFRKMLQSQCRGDTGRLPSTPCSNAMA